MMCIHCDTGEDGDCQCDETARLKDEIERLRDYVRADARCPCCDTTERCEDDCTFAADCPVEWQLMIGARKTLGVEVDE